MNQTQICQSYVGNYYSEYFWIFGIYYGKTGQVGFQGPFL